MAEGDVKSVRVTSRISEVDSEQWDVCAGSDNPFVSHAFLDILEQSEAASIESGWLPQHLLLENESGQLIGAVPCYLKNHSYGEYVFDWGWADAFQRAGGKYYPKLQVSVPFSPVTGPRLLVRPGANDKEIRDLLINALRALANQHEVSSLHITFCEKEERDQLEDQNFLKRLGQQFHWHNRGYTTFDDFLGALNSRKRKSIRKERQIANRAAEIKVLTGDDLKREHMEAFYQFYFTTVEKKWAHAYLNQEFFMLLQERLSNKIVMVMADDGGEYVGAALNLKGSNTLFGRNWGSSKGYPMLYFEACFYRAIEFAIENGISKVEAGAQGPHKISRGYLPSETYSAHWICDPAFRQAIAKFLTGEEKETEWEMGMLEKERSPYRKEVVI